MSLRFQFGVLLMVALMACSLGAARIIGQDGASSDAAQENSAQEDAGDEDDLRSALGVRHKRVERMMVELERKFTSLAEALEPTEPERAERLIETLQTAKQLLLQQRMTEITELLDSSSLDEATEEQIQVIEDLRALIEMLLNEQDDEDQRREEEIRDLERFKEQINDILQEEFPQERESRKIADREQALEDLDAQIRAVEELIEKQTNVNEATEQAEGAQAVDRVANEQHEVRRDTEEVERAIGAAGRPSDEPNGEMQGGEQQGGEQQGGEQQGGEQQGGEQQGGEQQGGEQQGGEQQGGEQQGGEQQGGEQQGGEQQGGEQQGGEQQGGEQQGGEQTPQVERPLEPGQQELRNAAQNQANAEQNLDQGKVDEAREDGDQALQDLEDALAELKDEQRRIASLPPEALEELAQDQRDTEEKTQELREAMEEAANRDSEGQQGGSESEGGNPSEGGNEGQAGQSGQQSPGQQQVQEAQQAMQNAAQNLEDQDPSSANRQQQEAIEKLEEALQEIEDRLSQLREETQEEKLARLEARFTEMLARQQEASAETKELNEKREVSGELRRGDRLQLAKLATEEQEIADLAQDAYDLLMEDGTSIVFPRIVEGLRDDLIHTSDLLQDRRTDELTQMVQADIERTLEELLDALKRARRNRQGGGGGGGGGGGNQPLLPTSAELKMLRAVQLRINHKTESLDLIRPEGTEDPAISREIEGVAQQQLELIELTEEVLRRQ